MMTFRDQLERLGTSTGLSWCRLVFATIARGYLVFLLALAACALAPMVTGMTGSVVRSGSMMPHIRVGDVVLSRAVGRDEALPMGRVITFVAPTGSAVHGLMLHRLVGVNRNGSLITKGDANVLQDGVALARSAILARASVLIPGIGLPALWLATGAFLPLVLWGVGTALAMLIELLAALAEHRRRRRVRATTLIERFDPSATGMLGLLVAILTVVALVSGASMAQVNASFTARTSSVGNSWLSAAAAKAVRLAFTSSPSSSTGGVAFSVQPVVAFRDSSGKTTTLGGSVTLVLTSAGSATVMCSADPVASVAGVSTFSGCAVDKAGTYTLTATSGALTSAISASFTVAVGQAKLLMFATSPTATTANTTFLTQPVVAVVDAGGNIVSTSSSIALGITPPVGATLTCGTNPQSAVAGRASFPGCRINLPGTYTLTAVAAGLVSATSASFLIGGPALPLLTCVDQTWMATFSWTPTPYAPTQYTLYINGIQVQATGADGWNSYVQLTSNNVPVSLFPQGTATLEVRRVTSTGQEVVIGDGSVVLGSAGTRTYTCH